VLVVDDSVNTGRELRRARDRVARADLPFAAVCVSPGAHGSVDHHVAVVPTPRLFGWNLFHHPSLRHCCVVADGLLWRRPAAADLADAAAYRRYLATADPLTLPTKRVGWVVTDRPASDREATAAWLDAHGVAYDRIVTLGRPPSAPPRPGRPPTSRPMRGC
jgi:orotate phosphoribosyltransferase